MDKALLGKPKIDAYVRLDYKGQKLKTKMLVQEKEGQIHWNQQFLIPLQVPLMGGRIVFKVMDEDTVCDEVVGSVNIDAKDFIDDEIVNEPNAKGRQIKQLNYPDW